MVVMVCTGTLFGFFILPIATPRIAFLCIIIIIIVIVHHGNGLLYRRMLSQRKHIHSQQLFHLPRINGIVDFVGDNCFGLERIVWLIVRNVISTVLNFNVDIIVVFICRRRSITIVRYSLAFLSRLSMHAFLLPVFDIAHSIIIAPIVVGTPLLARKIIISICKNGFDIVIIIVTRSINMIMLRLSQKGEMETNVLFDTLHLTIVVELYHALDGAVSIGSGCSCA
mmetsp:Transcript_23852/g.43226  ORF Transcript_23852/g.43226 Transcript_23852/m.43226 type:complete len:225 (-) Transcript_23852:659-1333(-)